MKLNVWVLVHRQWDITCDVWVLAYNFGCFSNTFSANMFSHLSRQFGHKHLILNPKAKAVSDVYYLINLHLIIMMISDLCSSKVPKKGNFLHTASSNHNRFSRLNAKAFALYDKIDL